jgi:hypothetical protein
MTDKDDPRREGHTREWQDRARVVLDAKKAAKTEASPNQSPEPESKGKDNDGGERENVQRREGDDEPVY